MNRATFEDNSGVLGLQPEAKEAVKVRYCLYARKSTEQDEQQALSIDSQIKEMTSLAARDGIDVVEEKRQLLEQLRGKLTLSNKEVRFNS